MAISRHKAPETKTAADTTTAVDNFMLALEHPQKAAIERLRRVVCKADPSIAEGVKWNAPSFRTHEYFATTHLRAKDGIALVLHLGAKVRDVATVSIADPQNLLKWLAKDRAIVAFRDDKDLKARASALQAILRQWIGYV
jgi:hypothetical protein